MSIMFVKPEDNIKHLGLQEGMKVADLGAGTGFYAKAISDKVGKIGKVYAVEVRKDMVKKLESELKEQDIKNVECIWGDIEILGGTKLSDESMDAVVVSNVLFQANDRLGLIDEAKRILKKGGKLLVVDWKESYEGLGPAPHHVVTEKVAEDLIVKRGFKLLERISSPYHHYGIIFKHE